MRYERKRDRAARALERLLEREGEEEFASRYEEIAAQVSERRRELELSQADLAELTGTTQSAIARLEAGKRAPRMDTLLRIANALDCQLLVDLRPRTKTKRGDEK